MNSECVPWGATTAIQKGNKERLLVQLNKLTWQTTIPLYELFVHQLYNCTVVLIIKLLNITVRYILAVLFLYWYYRYLPIHSSMTISGEVKPPLLINKLTFML